MKIVSKLALSSGLAVVAWLPMAVVADPLHGAAVIDSSCVGQPSEAEFFCSDEISPGAECAAMGMEADGGCTYVCPSGFTLSGVAGDHYCRHPGSNTNITGWMILQPDDIVPAGVAVSAFDNRTSCSGPDYPAGECNVAFIRIYGSNSNYGPNMTWTHLALVSLGHDGVTPQAYKKLTKVPRYRYMLVARYAGGVARSNPWVCAVSSIY